MALFAVIWSYAPNGHLLESNKAAHGGFLKKLATADILIEAGAWVDGSGAMLIVRAADADEVGRIFAADPYILSGVVASASVHEWSPALDALIAR